VPTPTAASATAASITPLSAAHSVVGAIQGHLPHRARYVAQHSPPNRPNEGNGSSICKRLLRTLRHHPLDPPRKRGRAKAAGTFSVALRGPPRRRGHCHSVLRQKGLSTTTHRLPKRMDPTDEVDNRRGALTLTLTAGRINLRITLTRTLFGGTFMQRRERPSISFLWAASGMCPSKRLVRGKGFSLGNRWTKPLNEMNGHKRNK
jgi:hypothetical protein